MRVSARHDSVQLILERVNHSLRSPLGAALAAVGDRAEGVPVDPKDLARAESALRTLHHRLEYLRVMACTPSRESPTLTLGELYDVLEEDGFQLLEASRNSTSYRIFRVSNGLLSKSLRLIRLLITDEKRAAVSKYSAWSRIGSQGDAFVHLSSSETRVQVPEEISLTQFAQRDFGMRGATAVYLAETLRAMGVEHQVFIGEGRKVEIEIMVPHSGWA